MAEDRYILLFLIFHFVVCSVLYVLFRTKILRTSRRLIVLVVLLPVWGGIMALLAEVYTRQNKAGEKEHELPQIEAARSTLYYRPAASEDQTEKAVVPLEEALIFDDSSIRRNLILEIVQEDPEHYIGVLKKVRLGEDPEVSHYASTAIMQVQRAYETDLQKKEQLLNQNKQDEEALQAYLDKLNEYIHSGLLADNVLAAQRRKLNTLYVSILSESDGDKELYRDAVDNLIELNEFTAAESLLLEADEKWKNEEAFILLKIKLYHKTKNGWALKKEIQQVNGSGMYLSPGTREMIEFWSS